MANLVPNVVFRAGQTKARQNTLSDQDQAALMSPSKSRILIVVLNSVLGAMIVSCGLVFPLMMEFVRRLKHALGGGVGETAMWGEPLFYIPLMAIHYFFPWGAIGAFVGGLVGWFVVKRSSLHKSQRRGSARMNPYQPPEDGNAP